MTDTQIGLNLAPQILATYREANGLAEQSKGYASEAVAKAIECGQLLLRQKESLGHGSWLEWLENNISEFGDVTARRYMALAKRSQVTDLNDAASVKQAYITTGILPAPQPKPQQTEEGGPPSNPRTEYIRWIDGFMHWFHCRLRKTPLEEWDEDARRVLKNALQPIVKEVYEKL